MNIIRVTREDILLVVPLFDDYRQFYKQPSDLEGARRFLQERILKDESVVFLAMDKEQAVGFVQLYPTFSSVALKRAYILNDLYVSEAARKKGVASLLMEAAYSYSSEQNGHYITLQTAVTNEEAQKLYKKMGMHVDEEMLNYIKYWR